MNLEKLFKPKTMAVVGISKKNPLSPGRIIFIKNVFEMEVHTYGIHPEGGEVEGVKLYKHLKDLPEIPDLLVIAIPAESSLEYVEQCVEYGIPACIIISGGFAEIGGDGVKRQNRLIKIATENDLAVLGPNCIGVYTPPLLDTIFMPTERITRPPKGTVALISQSGGVLVDQFFHKFNQINIGVSTAVSIGNRAVVDETMLLEYFSKHDPNTSNIAFYLEGFKKNRSREFLKHAKESEDMVVTYFGGLSEKGKKATQSHTASISGNERILAAALKQYLVVQPRTELELLTDLKLLEILSHKKKPFDSTSIKEGNVAILSLSGGHGVLCADLLEHYDLSAVDFTEKEENEMKKLVNSTARGIATFRNPIDLTGSAKDEDVDNLIQYLSEIERVECIIVLILPYTPSVTFQIGRRIANSVMQKKKPTVCFMPYIEKYGSIIEGLELSNIPVFHSIEEAVQAVAALKRRARILKIKKKN
ncbi:MAG: CoA-binding protein [Promethearchaeota archaeon]|nr:MAG: CoA-binding protein [Candidatus Lokiarchaeota archaeon]